MRSVSLSPAFGKRPLPHTAQAEPASASSFEQVLTATMQDAPPALRPLDRTGGRPRDAVPPLASPLPSRLRTIERSLSISSRLVRGNLAHTTDAPRPAARPRLRSLSRPHEAEAGAPPGTRPRIKTYGTTIIATAQQCGIDPALSLGVARAESGLSAATDSEVVLNPRAVSPDGTSFGLFQLTNATGQEQLQELAPHQTYDPFNPLQNIRLGVSYLRELADTFAAETQLRKGLSTVAGANEHEVRRLAVAAYNAGPGRVARAQEMVRAQGGNPAHYHAIEPYLPPETRLYVQRVARYAAEFRGSHLA